MGRCVILAPANQARYRTRAVFSALRAYVLTSRGRLPLAGLVFLLALAPVVINYVRRQSPFATRNVPTLL